jgi:hypothetical protein
MIGHLYRYPHPFDPTRFIYVGQGAKRDKNHRSGKQGFGLRFKKLFLGVDLPRPIREIVEIENQLELNELETIWMFRFHTWHGYEGGMNLTLPGSDDYKNMAVLANRVISATPGLRSALAKKIAQVLGPDGCSARAKMREKNMGIEKRRLMSKDRDERMGLIGRSIRSLKSAAAQTPEQRSNKTRRGRETMGPDACSATGYKSALTLGHDGCVARAKKALETMGKEGLSARAKKSAETVFLKTVAWG